MDKVTINNQVVQMRKFVKQAKIRAINNYTKEIRLLQNRKGNEDEISKYKRKAERLIAKVGILKKIQPDTVSRKALSKEKDWKAVLKEKNIPLEDQCYALLANYAAVQSEVEKFHKKHCELVPKIPTLFKDWEKKSKDPINKQQRREAKKLRKNMKNIKLDENSANAIPIMKNKMDTNKITILTTETTEKVLETVDGVVKNNLTQNDSKPTPFSRVGMDTIEKEGNSDMENEDIKKTSESESEEFKDTFDSKNEEITVSSVSEIEEIKETSGSEIQEIEEKKITPRKKSPLKLQVKKTPHDIQSRLKAISNNSQKVNMRGNREVKAMDKNTVSRNKLKTVTMLNLNEIQDFDEIPIEKTNDVVEEIGENKRKKDPFFLGRGEEVPSESEEDDSVNSGQKMDRPALKKSKFDRKSNDSSLNSSSKFGESGFKKNQKNSSFGDKNNSFKNKEWQGIDSKSKRFKNQSFGEKFPAQQFKTNAHTEVRDKKHLQKNNPNSPLKKSATDDKPLHPSWEAKRKLKEASNSKFQGKRIVFDD